MYRAQPLVARVAPARRVERERRHQDGDAGQQREPVVGAGPAAR